MKRVIIAAVFLLLAGATNCGSADNEDFLAPSGGGSSSSSSASTSSAGTTTSQSTNALVISDAPPVDASVVGAVSSTPTGVSSAGTSGSSVRWFLWKPSSERDGNLVVLIDPFNIRIEVFGNVSETLTNFGPSNDRGTTGRAGRSGCSFGSNVRVEFYDSAGRQVRVADGRTSVNIPNGCDRVEFRL